jgi:isopenicillin N synthase-like dioxygenase
MTTQASLQQQGAAVDVTFDRMAGEIPVIDIGPWIAGNDGALDALAAQVRRAQERIGFYFIVNHGVPASLIADSFAAIARFFALPAEDKLKLRVDEHQIGYIPPKASILRTSGIEDNRKPDTNEAFQLMRERGPDDPKVREGRRFSAMNKWPPEAVAPGLRAQMLAYHATMEALGRRMLPIYARALDLPADWFDAFFADDAHFINRNAHYAPGDHEDGQYGLGAHSDHGFMTFLPMSDEPGLEVKTQDGRWIAVPQVPGAMLINTGEFLNRWSNGRFIATPHRVLGPKRDRYALTFFYSPADETLSAPPPTCVGNDNPARFAPVTFLQYLTDYAEGNYLHQAEARRRREAAGTA